MPTEEDRNILFPASMSANQAITSDSVTQNPTATSDQNLLIGMKDKARRPTTAGQLLDNLNEINE